ncbi:MAG: NYN domain-containing protein [Dokdonella sp.]
MADTSNHRLAVLIDADNAQPTIVEALLAEVAKFGTASVKRCYGDWTGTHLRGWKETLLVHSIQPMQTFGYTVRKNSTDSAMIIDAMDLLYTEKFDGFCIVSSDSDFTRLASRLRESGQTVYGFGERKTPAPFVAACDRFIFTDILIQAPEATETVAKTSRTTTAATQSVSSTRLKSDTRLVNLLRAAVDAASDEAGWAQLGPVGSHIAKQASEFDPRNYGYTKLRELFEAIDLFDVDARKIADGPAMAVLVRDRRKR